MSSIFLDATQAVVKALQAAPQLVGVPVYRTHLRPIAATQNKAITVSFVSSEPTTPIGEDTPIEWQSMVQVESYAKTFAGQAADSAAHALHSLVAQTLAEVYISPLDAALVPLSVRQDTDAALEDGVAITASYLIYHNYNPRFAGEKENS